MVYQIKLLHTNKLTYKLFHFDFLIDALLVVKNPICIEQLKN